MTIKRAIERIEATRELADTDGQPSKSYVLGQALRILREEDDTKPHKDHDPLCQTRHPCQCDNCKEDPCQCEKCKNGRAKALMENIDSVPSYHAEGGEWEKQLLSGVDAWIKWFKENGSETVSYLSTQSVEGMYRAFEARILWKLKHEDS